MHLGVKNELSGTFNHSHKALKIHKFDESYCNMKVLLRQIIFGPPLYLTDVKPEKPLYPIKYATFVIQFVKINAVYGFLSLKIISL